jgi:hypothetical protein
MLMFRPVIKNIFWRLHGDSIPLFHVGREHEEVTPLHRQEASSKEVPSYATLRSVRPAAWLLEYRSDAVEPLLNFWDENLFELYRWMISGEISLDSCDHQIGSELGRNAVTSAALQVGHGFWGFAVVTWWRDPRLEASYVTSGWE